MKAFTYVQPHSLDEAAVLAQDTRAMLKAGGIDLLDQMKEGTLQPAQLINLRAVADLAFVREEAGALHLGPATTLDTLAQSPLVRRLFAAVADAAGSAATPQIRNVATLAGNLCQRPRCWYFRTNEFPCLKKGGSQCYAKQGENHYHAIFGGGPSYIVHPSTMATALVACDARLRIRSASGKDVRSRELLLEEFFTLPVRDPTRENVLEPGELISEILVPPLGDVRSAYLAVKERQVYDWPLGEAAVSLVIKRGVVERARVVLGSCAPIPWRVPRAEDALIGKRINADVAKRAAAAALVGARPLADNAYKVPLLQALVERTLLLTAERNP